MFCNAFYNFIAFQILEPNRSAYFKSIFLGLTEPNRSEYFEKYFLMTNGIDEKLLLSFSVNNRS